MPQSKVQIPMDGITLNCTTEEISSTFSWLLAEMRSATPRLRPDERAVLRRIMAHKSGTLTVGEIFPEFTRESEAHKTLRRLRAGQFIRPAKTGRWDLNEPIEVKPFGWLIWNQCGEAGLFGSRHENGHALKNGKDADDSVIDLASPDVKQNGHALENNQEPDDAIIDLASPNVSQFGSEAAEFPADENLAAGDNDLLDLLDFAKDEANGRR